MLIENQSKKLINNETTTFPSDLSPEQHALFAGNTAKHGADSGRRVYQG